MQSPVEQQTFDAGERELIRKKLIHYMKENGIGAPKLAERIKASHPRGTEAPSRPKPPIHDVASPSSAPTCR